MPPRPVSSSAGRGCLYLSQEDVASRMQKLGQAAPLIKILATDPSLRGLAHTLSLSLGGLQTGHYALDDLARPLNTIADSLDQVLAGKSATFSWQVLVNNAPAKPADLMSLINIWPVLDYSSIEPGQKATAAVRKAVDNSKIGPTYDATVQLTGTVPLADLQFSTLHEGVALNFAVTGIIIIGVLWLALRSIRIVVAVCICIFRRSAGDRGARPVAGRIVQSDLGGLRRAVRRSRRRFRDPVQRALPRATP